MRFTLREPLRRLPDWEARGQAWRRRAEGETLIWGVSDCLLTPADAVLAVTGVDVAADLRGRYRDALGAKRLLADLGGTQAVVTERLRTDPLDGWKRARRFDLVMVVEDDEPRLAVMVAVDRLALRAAEGLAYRFARRGLITWRVG